jgi:hypothetical protein
MHARSGYHREQQNRGKRGAKQSDQPEHYRSTCRLNRQSRRTGLSHQCRSNSGIEPGRRLRCKQVLTNDSPQARLIGNVLATGGALIEVRGHCPTLFGEEGTVQELIEQ